MKDNMAETQIEQAFSANAWLGLISLEEAIADAIAYRRGLSVEERQVYDTQLELGRHPVSALETVEMLSGRQQPQGSERVLQSIMR